MSALYFELYVGKDDEFGLKMVREFFSLSKAKNWDGLIELFGDSCRKVAHVSPDEPREILHKEFDHYFSIAKKERETEHSIMFEFDTFTSFADHEFITLLLQSGVSRIEVSIENSQVGITHYFENDVFADQYHDRQWRWLPEPTI